MTGSSTLFGIRISDRAPGDQEMRWRVLRLLNLFRAIAAGAFTLMFFQENRHLLGSEYPQLYLYTGVAYFALALIASFTLQTRKPPLFWQTVIQLLADLAAIILLTHASGGQSSGLPNLLFVVVAAASVLLDRRLALLYAALVSLAVLGEQFLSMLRGFADSYGYTRAGIMGAIFFATALVSSWVAERARESEALATRRGLDLANLSQVNNLIIQNLGSGVVVVDADDRIRQINAAAMRFLDLGGNVIGREAGISPQLRNVVAAWRKGGTYTGSLRGADGTLYIPQVQNIGDFRDGSLMIFLENAEKVAEDIQQMKLAALGRLTASIAHEVRNPIGAISHAGQLLEESDHLAAEDRRFVGIIRQQAMRVNEVVESILQLGRREQFHPERLEITAWLRDFVMEYCDTNGMPLDAVELDTTGDEVHVRIDPGHLRQILLNLLENARHHAGATEDGQLAILRLSRTLGGGTVWLDVVDFGPGIDSSIVNRVFEPFYTHSRSGTGLGLFVARELCECNHATLKYGKDGDGRSCFRIRFQDEPAWLN